MNKVEQIKAITVDENGVMSLNACCDEANSDWIRAGRLAVAAKAGDKQAAEELVVLGTTPMMREVEDD